MAVQILLIAGACGLGAVASILMTRASNRSALWNMAFGAALALVVLLGVLVVALLLTRAAFPLGLVPARPGGRPRDLPFSGILADHEVLITERLSCGAAGTGAPSVPGNCRRSRIPYCVRTSRKASGPG